MEYIKVTLRNGRKAIRKFETLQDAYEWVWLREDMSKYRIVFKYENESDPRHIYF